MTPNETMKFHLALNKESIAVIKESTSDPTEAGLGQELIDQLYQWSRAIHGRPEAMVFRNAISEATVGEFLLISGLYRPAFTALRLFLEMSLAAVHFSANRVELAEWVQGRKDVVWSVLIDPANGVLSPRYANAFFPELRETVMTYNAIGAKVYRELSEYVHGNSHTWSSTKGAIVFDPELKTLWIRKFEAASTVVTYALALRFMKELDLQMTPDLATTLSCALGHVEAVRDILNGGE